MGQHNGFMVYDREGMEYRPVEERLKDYRDVTRPIEEATLFRQGARCMDCGIPYCHSLGCPVVNLIPEWNDLIYQGQWKEAYDRLDYTNNLPEVTGRVCPAPCESACTLAINDAPVTIKKIELAIIEHAWKEGWVTPKINPTKSGKKVAVVGSGPSGLAAAQQLARAGHAVSLFERSSKVGGLLRFGIPDFKMEKWVLDRRMEQMAAEGVTFETGVTIGEDLSVKYLQQHFDAILLTLGAGAPRDLAVPGRSLAGVHFAMEYLTLSNKMVSGEVKRDQIIDAKGKRVLVIGGGDTGSDCVGTANRQGARSVHQFEIMPKPPEWNAKHNSNWPDWPNILRTSSSHEEGCVRDWCINTKQLMGENGELKRGEFVRVEWEKEATGRFVMKEVPGSNFLLEVDLVFLAMGFVSVEKSALIEQLGVVLDGRGNIQVDRSYATSVPGVFSAGDATTGASLVVRAINHGRRAAAHVDAFLKKSQAF